VGRTKALRIGDKLPLNGLLGARVQDRATHDELFCDPHSQGAEGDGVEQGGLWSFDPRKQPAIDGQPGAPEQRNRAFLVEEPQVGPVEDPCFWVGKPALL